MTSTAQINLANLHESVGFKKAVPPEPKIYAMSAIAVTSFLRGELTLHRVNLRCRTHKFKVRMETVCDSHSFQYTNRGDK
jgi:hypothetical protein